MRSDTDDADIGELVFDDLSSAYMSGKLPIANIQKGDGKIISAPLTSFGNILEFIGKTYEKDALLYIVLAVDAEKVDYTEIEGGSSDYVVPYLISEVEGEITATTDEKYDDIIEAIEYGKTVKIETSGLVEYHTSSFLILDDSFTIPITMLVPVDTDVYDIACFQIVHTKENVIHFWTN